MARFRLLPDEIHNFAHNNEWLVRNLILVGRVQDALDLSRDLVSLPQHPRHNTLSERGSYAFGRQRLLQVLSEYGLWEELLREAGGHYLPPTDDDRAQEEWLGWLSVAQFMSGEAKAGGKTLRSLQRRRLALQERLISLRENQAEEEEREEIEEKEEKPAADAAESPEKIKEHLEELRRVIARAAAAAAARRKDLPTLKKQMETAKLDSLIRAQWLADAGDLDEAIQLAEQAVKDDEAQVRPLAILVDLLWRKERKDEALERFASLRTVAGHADLATPMLARLEPVVTAAGLSGDWRTPPAPAGDLGERPPLDQLGPIRWQPYTAPSWSAHTADNELVSGEEYEARPRIVIFYLGFGCLHCMEQLHAFAPKIEAFRELGVDLVAISTETVDELQHGIKNYEKQMEIRLLSDGEKQVFKSFRCWDDFENQPLHGTFLIDAKGQVRWQDIGFEPFNDPEFLLKETKRLLDLP
jgi:peroxiredoxin